MASLHDAFAVYTATTVTTANVNTRAVLPAVGSMLALAVLGRDRGFPTVPLVFFVSPAWGRRRDRR